MAGMQLLLIVFFCGTACGFKAFEPIQRNVNYNASASGILGVTSKQEGFQVPPQDKPLFTPKPGEHWEKLEKFIQVIKVFRSFQNCTYKGQPYSFIHTVKQWEDHARKMFDNFLRFDLENDTALNHTAMKDSFVAFLKFLKDVHNCTWNGKPFNFDVFFNMTKWEHKNQTAHPDWHTKNSTWFRLSSRFHGSQQSEDHVRSPWTSNSDKNLKPPGVHEAEQLNSENSLNAEIVTGGKPRDRQSVTANDKAQGKGHEKKHHRKKAHRHDSDEEREDDFEAETRNNKKKGNRESKHHGTNSPKPLAGDSKSRKHGNGHKHSNEGQKEKVDNKKSNHPGHHPSDSKNGDFENHERGRRDVNGPPNNGQKGRVGDQESKHPGNHPSESKHGDFENHERGRRAVHGPPNNGQKGKVGDQESKHPGNHPSESKHGDFENHERGRRAVNGPPNNGQKGKVGDQESKHPGNHPSESKHGDFENHERGRRAVNGPPNNGQKGKVGDQESKHPGNHPSESKHGDFENHERGRRAVNGPPNNGQKGKVGDQESKHPGNHPSGIKQGNSPIQKGNNGKPEAASNNGGSLHSSASQNSNNKREHESDSEVNHLKKNVYGKP